MKITKTLPVTIKVEDEDPPCCEMPRYSSEPSGCPYMSDAETRCKRYGEQRVVYRPKKQGYSRLPECIEEFGLPGREVEHE